MSDITITSNPSLRDNLFSSLSFLSAALIGIDCAVTVFVYSVGSITLWPALSIAFCGFILNWFVYHKDGFNSYNDLYTDVPENQFLPSWVIDLISVCGALIMGFFTFNAYHMLLAEFVFLQPFFPLAVVLVMSIAIGLGTYTLNKSALMHLKPANFVLKENLSLNSYVILGLGTIVALAVSVLLSLTLFNGACAVFPASSLVAVVFGFFSLAFFIGELVFNFEQWFTLLNKEGHWNISQWFLSGMVVFALANGLGNAFVALGLERLQLKFIPIFSLIAGFSQSVITMLNNLFSVFGTDDLDSKSRELNITGNNLKLGASLMTLMCATYISALFVGPCALVALIATYPVFRYFTPQAEFYNDNRSSDTKPLNSALLKDDSHEGDSLEEKLLPHVQIPTDDSNKLGCRIF